MQTRQAKLIRRIAWSIWVVYSLAIMLGLAWFGPRMQPIPRGTAIDFWETACGVDLDSKGSPRSGAAYWIDREWVAYEWSHFHGSDIYRVPADEAELLFPAVIQALQAQRDAGHQTRYVKGFDAFRESRTPSTMSSLIRCQQNARHAESYADGIDRLSYAILGDQDVYNRWQRAKSYWSNFVFEWLLLSGLGLFALWPAVRSLSLYRWAAHASLLPLLFLLPAYLGYATWSVTSAGPCGGVLYPHLLCFAGRGNTNRVDRYVLQHLPDLLEPVSSSPGMPMAISGGIRGPSSAIQIGLLLAAIVFVIGLVVRRVQSRRARLNAPAAPPVQ